MSAAVLPFDRTRFPINDAIQFAAFAERMIERGRWSYVAHQRTDAAEDFVTIFENDGGEAVNSLARDPEEGYVVLDRRGHCVHRARSMTEVISLWAERA
jgi:hypothetical protein